MEKILKVGVVGLGMGKSHIKGFQLHPQAEVVALADLNKDLLAQQSQEFQVAAQYEDYREMLAQEHLDVISIATPNFLHLPIALAAFDAGCHVLCEKPMALNTAEANTMLTAARQEIGRAHV